MLVLYAADPFPHEVCHDHVEETKMVRDQVEEAKVHSSVPDAGDDVLIVVLSVDRHDEVEEVKSDTLSKRNKDAVDEVVGLALCPKGLAWSRHGDESRAAEGG